MPDEATRSHPQEVQIEVEFDQAQPTICGGRGHRDGATSPSASPGKTHLSNRVGRSPRPHLSAGAKITPTGSAWRGSSKSLRYSAARPAEPSTMRLLTKTTCHAVTIANAYQTQDSMKTRNAAYFVSPRISSIRDLACLIATARLTGVTPAFFFPSPNLTSHRQPIPSSN